MDNPENGSNGAWNSGDEHELEKEKRRKNWRRKMEDRDFDDWESDDWEREYRRRGRFYDEDDEEDLPEYIDKEDEWTDDEDIE